MIFFALPGYEQLAKRLAKTTRGKHGRVRLARYKNGELHLSLQPTRLARAEVAVVGSIAPPDSQLMSFGLLADTLKRHGAQSVTAILPFLAYARHDQPLRGASLATAWAGQMLKASGVDRVVTLDVHSEKAVKLCPIPVRSISSAELFAPIVAKHWADASIVAPDDGAKERAVALRHAAGNQPSIVIIHKRRDVKGVVHLGMSGRPKARAVVIDDQLDTGETLISACRALRAAGTTEIAVMVTHGLFTGKRWQDLWKLGVKEIFVTDSVAHRPPQSNRIHVVPCGQLLAKNLS